MGQYYDMSRKNSKINSKDETQNTLHEVQSTKTKDVRVDSWHGGCLSGGLGTEKIIGAASLLYDGRVWTRLQLGFDERLCDWVPEVSRALCLVSSQ